jgi:hypothetical protein
VELLEAVEQAEKKGDEGKAAGFRKGIEKLLEENGLGPVTLQPEGYSGLKPSLIPVYGPSRLSPDTYLAPAHGVSVELPDAAWLNRHPRDPSTTRPSATAKAAYSMRSAQDDRVGGYRWRLTSLYGSGLAANAAKGRESGLVSV